MSDFLDLHVIVKPLEGQNEGPFFVTIADAPVDRLHLGFWHLGAPGTAFQDLLKGLGYTWNPGMSYSAAYAPPPGLEVALFDALFPPASRARELLRNSCSRLRGTQILRLKLELHSTLANLPWEAMRPSEALLEDASIWAAKKAIVRYLGDADAGLPSVDSEGVIVIIRAHPMNVETNIVASLDREITGIRGQLGEKHEFVCITGANTRRKLEEELNEIKQRGKKVVGLHYLGHAAVDKDGGSYLCWEDKNSELDKVTAISLNAILADVTSLNWVVLNACCSAFTHALFPLSGMATHLSLVKKIPAVIGYNRPVHTEDAEIFGGKFFPLILGRKQSIEEVVLRMQQQLSNPGGLLLLWRSVRPDTMSSQSRDFETREQVRAAAAPEAAESPRTAPDRSTPDTPKTGHAQAKGGVKAPPGMVYVPAGLFKKGLNQKKLDILLRRFQRMGVDVSSARQALTEEVEEEVSLPAFLIDRTPVTNAEFAHFVKAERYKTDAERADSAYTWLTFQEKEDHPVVYVSLRDAMAFCTWAGKQLPSADQWKKAARGPGGLIYPWGDEFSTAKCNTAESVAGYQTTPVENFAPYASPYDCLDMVGNVEEWTASTDESGRHRIFGGSWAMTCEIYGIPILYRIAAPDFYDNDLGFRCVRNAPNGV